LNGGTEQTGKPERLAETAKHAELEARIGQLDRALQQTASVVVQ
jgi:hypothetical protein